MSKLLVLDGRDKLEMWWVEEGYLTDLSSVLLVRLSQSLCGSRRQSALLYTLGSRFDAVHVCYQGSQPRIPEVLIGLVLSLRSSGPCVIRESNSELRLLYHSLLAGCGLQALEESKTRDRLYIPSRYQLFTLNQVRQVRTCHPEHHQSKHIFQSRFRHHLESTRSAPESKADVLMFCSLCDNRA